MLGDRICDFNMATGGAVVQSPANISVAPPGIDLVKLRHKIEVARISSLRIELKKNQSVLSSADIEKLSTRDLRNHVFCLRKQANSLNVVKSKVDNFQVPRQMLHSFSDEPEEEESEEPDRSISEKPESQDMCQMMQQ